MVWAEDGELHWFHAKAMQAPVDHVLQMLDEGYYEEQGLPPVRVAPDGEFRRDASTLTETLHGGRRRARSQSRSYERGRSSSECLDALLLF